MEPNKIKLESLNKLFEYEKHARFIDECNDIDLLKDLSKSYIKLYLQQQEVLHQMGQIGSL